MNRVLFLFIEVQLHTEFINHLHIMELHVGRYGVVISKWCVGYTC